jgi:hypothetical protein
MLRVTGLAPDFFQAGCFELMLRACAFFKKNKVVDCLPQFAI